MVALENKDMAIVLKAQGNKIIQVEPWGEEIEYATGTAGWPAASTTRASGASHSPDVQGLEIE